jgi:hypothetical protein
MDQRISPRFKHRGKIDILAVEDKKIVSEAQSVDVNYKGVRFEATNELAPSQTFYIVFGRQRAIKLEVSAQILAKYVKEGRQCYSARFVEEDMMQKTRIRNYVEKVRTGEI